MKLPADEVEIIMDLGYTETEARFLYLVATHTGYFTMRHFLSFAGARCGKRSSSFAQKVLRHGHASIRDYMGTGSVFHLFSRLVYGRIEKDNLRNRRRHSFDYIRNRLVLLDFVLENLHCEFLETEQDKVRFFCETLAVPKDVLPAKVYGGTSGARPTIRYFVDKFPLFLSSPISDASAVVTFSYVDAGGTSVSNLGAHLAAYQGLFRHLNAFRFLYIANRPAGFPRAEKRFRSFVKEPLATDVSAQILRYFAVRRKWERHEYVVPITEDLEFLSDARRRFHGQRFEDLYLAWQAGELDEPALRAGFTEATPAKKVFFETYLVRAGRGPLDEQRKKYVNAR
jgi:hypothetical protein